MESNITRALKEYEKTLSKEFLKILREQFVGSDKYVVIESLNIDFDEGGYVNMDCRYGAEEGIKWCKHKSFSFPLSYLDRMDFLTGMFYEGISEEE